MTIIAWDGTKLAADKLMSIYGAGTTVTKIRKINGNLVGGAGSSAVVQEMFKWIENGCDPDKFPEKQKAVDTYANMVVITPDKKILTYETTAYPTEIEHDYYAIGSGRDFALALMHVGYGSEYAVIVTNELSAHCGNGVDTLSFDE